MSPRTGRRPGDSGTRAAILDAAKEQFAARGYDGATIRGIAAAAGVDPALVHHWFGTKRHLFVEATALPADPGAVLPQLLSATPREELGAVLVRTFLTVWEPGGGVSPLVALLRSAVTDADTARMLREFLTREIFGRVAGHLGIDEPARRAALVASQLVGVAMVRHVLAAEPLASATHDQLVAWVGPTVQRYLFGDLDR